MCLVAPEKVRSAVHSTVASEYISTQYFLKSSCYFNNVIGSHTILSTQVSASDCTRYISSYTITMHHRQLVSYTK